MAELEELYGEALASKNNPQVFEQKLNSIIVSDALTNDENLKAKELSFYSLADLYIQQNHAEKVKQMVTNYTKVLENLPGAKSAKILKNLVDKVSKVKGILPVQVDLCELVIEWCKKGSRTHLRHKQEIRLAGFYLQQQKYQPAIALMEALLVEVRKSDDKHLLVEAQLIESRVHFALENYSKAKASLTSARASANQVYCEPTLQAELDGQSGIIFAQEKDYKTSYSYYYEAFEALHSLKDAKALDIFKYMILCKVMTKQHDDVNGLIAGKYGTFYAGPEVEAVRLIAQANKQKSLIQFQNVMAQQAQYLNDHVIKNITTTLYEQLLEENLFKLIEPYSRVQIDHLAKTINLSQDIVQKKLSELILDKKIEGTLDQGNGCLILFDDLKCDDLYTNASDLINSMNEVVDKLFLKAKKMKQ